MFGQKTVFLECNGIALCFIHKKFDQEQKIAENSNKGEIFISANLYLLTERAFHEQMQNLIEKLNSSFHSLVQSFLEFDFNSVSWLKLDIMHLFFVAID